MGTCGSVLSAKSKLVAKEENTLFEKDPLPEEENQNIFQRSTSAMKLFIDENISLIKANENRNSKLNLNAENKTLSKSASFLYRGSQEDLPSEKITFLERLSVLNTKRRKKIEVVHTQLANSNASITKFEESTLNSVNEDGSYIESKKRFPRNEIKNEPVASRRAFEKTQSSQSILNPRLNQITVAVANEISN